MTRQEFKELRKESGHTQIHFGELLKISGCHVSCIEAGSRKISPNVEQALNLLYPDTDREEISFIPLGNATAQVQVDGSSVGLLYAGSGGWDYYPDGMAARYGKSNNKSFKNIYEFETWWNTR